MGQIYAVQDASGGRKGIGCEVVAPRRPGTWAPSGTLRTTAHKKPRPTRERGSWPEATTCVRTWRQAQPLLRAPACWEGCWPCLVANGRLQPRPVWRLAVCRRRGRDRRKQLHPQPLAWPRAWSCGSARPPCLATGTACSCPPCRPCGLGGSFGGLGSGLGGWSRQLGGRQRAQAGGAQRHHGFGGEELHCCHGAPHA